MVPTVARAAIRACSEGRWKWPLFMHGPAGVGKTCACLWALDHIGGRFTTFRDLCRTVQDAKLGKLITHGSHDSCVVGVDDFWQGWSKSPLVVVDDLGVTGRPTDHAYEVALDMLEHRYGQPMIVTSNLDLDQIAGVFDDRISSRLSAGSPVLVSGEDLRNR